VLVLSIQLHHVFFWAKAKKKQQKVKVLCSPHIEDTARVDTITPRRKLENRNLWDTEQHFCNAAVQVYVDPQITPNLLHTSSRDRETMKEMPTYWIKNWMQENGPTAARYQWLWWQQVWLWLWFWWHWIIKTATESIRAIQSSYHCFFKFISISYTKSSWLRASSWPKQPVTGQPSPTKILILVFFTNVHFWHIRILWQVFKS